MDQSHDRPDDTMPAEEDGLEAAVKGIAQGIAGKWKEMAGELVGDDELEEKGIAQQLEGQFRRSRPYEEGVPGPPDDVPAVSPEELPPGLRSRVMAATAHAQWRCIERRANEPGPGVEYEVSARTEDRFVYMVLAVWADGSVAETTETWLRDQIVEVSVGDDRGIVDVHDGTGWRRIAVPLAVVKAIDAAPS